MTPGAVAAVELTLDYVKTASDAAGELYRYGRTGVLFKLTKATKSPFRPTGGYAVPY